MSDPEQNKADPLVVRHKKALARLRKAKAALAVAKAEIGRLQSRMQLLEYDFSQNQIMKRVKEQWDFQATREETFKIAQREAERHISRLQTRITELERERRSVVNHLKLISNE